MAKENKRKLSNNYEVSGFSWLLGNSLSTFCFWCDEARWRTSNLVKQRWNVHLVWRSEWGYWHWEFVPGKNQKLHSQANLGVKSVVTHNFSYSLIHSFQTLTDDNGDSTSASLLDLFRTPKMRKYTLILMFNWWVSSETLSWCSPDNFFKVSHIEGFRLGRFTSAVVYQGLIMRVGITGGNIYIDFLISGLVEFPAAFLILFTIERIGRRLPFSAANVVAGVSCLITACIPDSETYFCQQD